LRDPEGQGEQQRILGEERQSESDSGADRLPPFEECAIREDQEERAEQVPHQDPGVDVQESTVDRERHQPGAAGGREVSRGSETEPEQEHEGHRTAQHAADRGDRA
jgi:hypothetical protein